MLVGYVALRPPLGSGWPARPRGSPPLCWLFTPCGPVPAVLKDLLLSTALPVPVVRVWSHGVGRIRSQDQGIFWSPALFTTIKRFSLSLLIFSISDSALTPLKSSLQLSFGFTFRLFRPLLSSLSASLTRILWGTHCHTRFPRVGTPVTREWIQLTQSYVITLLQNLLWPLYITFSIYHAFLSFSTYF